MIYIFLSILIIGFTFLYLLLKFDLKEAEKDKYFDQEDDEDETVIF